MVNNFAFTITSELHDSVNDIYEELADNNLEEAKKIIDLTIKQLRELKENLNENEEL